METYRGEGSRQLSIPSPKRRPSVRSIDGTTGHHLWLSMLSAPITMDAVLIMG